MSCILVWHCWLGEASKLCALVNADHIYTLLFGLRTVQSDWLIDWSTQRITQIVHTQNTVHAQHIKWKIEQNTTLFVVQHSFVVILFIFISFNALPNRFISWCMHNQGTPILNETLSRSRSLALSFNCSYGTAAALHHHGSSFMVLTQNLTTTNDTKCA